MASLPTDLLYIQKLMILRQALEFARLLDIPYLWIDSLCVLQDSVPDWLGDSSMMGEI